MTKCCDKDCVTIFCPHCGKQVNKSPISELRAHIKAQVRAFETSIVSYSAHLEEGDDAHRAWAKRRLEKKTIQRDKWQSWLDAISQKEPNE